LGITLAVYAVVAVSSLAAVGPVALALSNAPLATVVRAGDLDALAPAVRIGGAIAAAGVLLSLIAGASRTAFAMAADGHLPRRLAAVHPTHKVPHHAELAVGTLVGLLVAFTDLRGAIGFSSFCVLGYYAIANASAWTLPASTRRWPRLLAAAGIAGCGVLAVTLPAASVVAGSLVLAAGAAAWYVRGRHVDVD
jgi:APA family basic amino acid/polyamine antiporter